MVGPREQQQVACSTDSLPGVSQSAGVAIDVGVDGESGGIYRAVGIKQGCVRRVVQLDQTENTSELSGGGDRGRGSLQRDGRGRVNDVCADGVHDRETRAGGRD